MLTPMSLYLLTDLDSLIRKMNLVEVKTSRIIKNGNINEESLFSLDIFGSFGSAERVTKFAYVDLGAKFLHPYAMQVLNQESLFKYIMLGGYFVVINNKIERFEEGKDGHDESKALVGLKSLHDNWSAYVNSIEDLGTETRSDMLKFFQRYNREQLWLSKWPILPAGLREINLMEFQNTGVINYEPINDLYISLINFSIQIRKLSASEGLFTDMNFDATFAKIQNILHEIHDFITRGTLSGKDKFIRKNTLKRAVMYSGGAVISMAPNNSHSATSTLTNNIRTGEAGIPLTLLIDTYYPFVIHQMNIYINAKSELKDFIRREVFKGKMVSDNELIEGFLDRCINDFRILSKPILTLTTADGGELDYLVMDFIKNDIMFPILGKKNNVRKFLLITRYPIERFKSTQFIIPVPYTTSNVAMVTLDNGSSVEVTLDPNNYSTSIVINQSSLKSYGGDFDGDKVIIMGIFTNEANADIRNKKASFRDNNLDISLNQTALIGIESLMGLNSLTAA